MSKKTNSSVDIRPGSERFHTVNSWLNSWHCFSFANHYDPTNTNHGLLLVSNDDRVAPGGGFGTHSHRDMEIVTWVLEGRLEHRDSEGNQGEIYPGLVQRMSAGTGIRHSEMNPSQHEAVHFLQMWVQPDKQGLQPSYDQVDVSEALKSGKWTAIASGVKQETGTRIHQKNATLWAARPNPGSTLIVPEAPHVHLFVARGSIKFSGYDLQAGDAVRLQSPAKGEYELTVSEPDVEVLAWATG